MYIYIFIIVCFVCFVLLFMKQQPLSHNVKNKEEFSQSDLDSALKKAVDFTTSEKKIKEITDGLFSGISGILADALKIFDSKIPDKKPCSDWNSRYRDDNTSCWLDTYGRGAGRPRDGSCPHGWRNDGTSCWEDLNCTTVDKGYWNESWGAGWCNGPQKRPTHAPWWLGGGRTGWDDCYSTWIADLKTTCTGCGCIKQGTNHSCRSDEDMIGLLCYPKCDPGYRAVSTGIFGNYCEPNEGPGIKVTAMQRYKCPPSGAPEYTKLKDALCYKP